MAEENEIVAKFVADIEQYQKDVNAAAATTGTLDKSVNQVNASTQKFEKHTKGAANSISALSRGLGGITGLLGITGRLFGVNTDKLEGFIFASREFIKVAKDVQHAQHLSNLATTAGAAATTKLSVAQRILNAVMAINPFILWAAGVAALSAAIVYLSSKYGLWGLESDKQREKNEELMQSNDLLKNSVQELGRIYSEEINKRKALGENTDKLEKEALERQLKSVQAQIKNFNDLTGMTEEQFAERAILLNKEASLKNDIIILDTNRKSKADAEELAALREFQKDKNDVNVEANDKNIEAAKKYAAELEAQRLKDLEDSANFFSKLNEQNKKEIEDGYNEIKKLHFKAGEDSIKLFQEGAKKFAAENQDDAELLNEFGRTKDAQKKVDDAAEERRLKRLEDEKMVLDTIFSAQQAAFDKRQELLKDEQTLQEANIETQRKLAERGLENTLAFEEKRAAELQRQQQVEAQKQKRIKLLETFLNSLAEFSKTDPKTAISKALLQVALAQAASAVFAEEGGVIGEIGSRSNLGRRHKGGGDVLLHAQTGEGVLPRDAMSAIGRRNFELLKNAGRHPIRDDVFGMPRIAMIGGSQVNNSELLKEVQGLRRDIKNQPRESFDINKWGEYTRTTIENGVTEVTKGKLKKPRFRA